MNTIEVHVNFSTCFEMLKMASCCLIYLTLVKTNQINGRDPVQNLPELHNFMQYYTWYQACRWRLDDICHPPVKSHPKSHSRVICMSSACCLHVVCTRLQLPKYFQLNSRTALLTKTVIIVQLPHKLSDANNYILRNILKVYFKTNTQTRRYFSQIWGGCCMVSKYSNKKLFQSNGWPAVITTKLHDSYHVECFFQF